MNIIIVKRPLGRVQQRLVPASLSPYPRVSRRSRPAGAAFAEDLGHDSSGAVYVLFRSTRAQIPILF